MLAAPALTAQRLECSSQRSVRGTGCIECTASRGNGVLHRRPLPCLQLGLVQQRDARTERLPPHRSWVVGPLSNRTALCNHMW
jgi:hypothetical protein